VEVQHQGARLCVDRAALPCTPCNAAYVHCCCQELERRLASVIQQGFDDCNSISGQFKLLDSFQGLLSRPIVAVRAACLCQ
jgi:hypothetical protein